MENEEDWEGKEKCFELSISNWDLRWGKEGNGIIGVGIWGNKKIDIKYWIENEDKDLEGD